MTVSNGNYKHQCWVTAPAVTASRLCRNRSGGPTISSLPFSSLSTALLGLCLVVCGIQSTVSAELQPLVMTVEQNPSRKVWSSLSMPEGSPWCDGKPTYWLVGHQPTDERPWCLQDETTMDAGNVTAWEQSPVALLDSNDDLNDLDGPGYVDRHSCTHMDVNQDGVPDIICLVGANKGTGNGYNELYITQSNGSLVKVPDALGLQKYPSMRGRFIKTLRGADGSDLVFIATRGKPRTDGRPNEHRMFRLVYQIDGGSSFFEEVEGPWIQHTIANSIQVADVNSDGLDDLIVCNDKNVPAFLFVQHPNATWTQIPLKGKKSKKWRSVRVADVTYDGVPDLAVVGGSKEASYFRILEGMSQPPYFDFKAPYVEYDLPYATPDLEILDVNGDGLLDIYVVQDDEATSGTYCGKDWTNRDWWGKGSQPPPEFVPPLDVAADLLFVGQDGSSSEPFQMVVMEHAEPGCGHLVERFGDDQRALLLAQGENGRPGHNLILQWPAR